MKDVSYEEKQKLISDTFNKIAAEYDKMNDVFSFGAHRVWKSQFVDMLGPLKMKKALNENGEVKSE